MKIVLTTGGVIWDYERYTLNKYKKDLIVVNMGNGKKDNMEGLITIECDIDFTGLGFVIDGGFNSPYYKTLMHKQSEIYMLFEEGEDVIVLGDMFVQSLYILKVLQQCTKRINLHLWAVGPFKFESQRTIDRYYSLLCDLRNISSITLMDPGETIVKYGNPYTPICDSFDAVREVIDGIFEDHLRKIMSLDINKKYFYDYRNEKFISVNEGNLFQDDKDEQVVDGIYTTIAKIITENVDHEKKLRQVKQQIPRVNGKEICSKLRRLRKAYADANNIPYTFKECCYEGPCAGTCAYCDDELKTLSERSKENEYVPKIFPQYEIQKDDLISKQMAERLDVGTMGFLLSKEEWEKRNE